MTELIEPVPAPTGTRAGMSPARNWSGTGTSRRISTSRAWTTPPTDATITDETRAELAAIAARYPQARSALLPMLHLVQSVEGRVTPAGIEACAEILGLTTAEVSGVATFYTMYKRRPVGEYHVGVCTTALCAIMGGDEVYARLQDHLGIGNDETTDDGLITLEHVECNAACDFAPVMMVNWEFFDNTTPQKAIERGRPAPRRRDDARPPAGPGSCTWREAERVLAGFPDGRADEGADRGRSVPAGPEHRPRARLVGAAGAASP